MPLFYEMTEFEGVREHYSAINWPNAEFELVAEVPILPGMMDDEFSCMPCERHGVLRGEYLIVLDGLMLLRRDGLPVYINISPENAYFQHLTSFPMSGPFMAQAVELLKHWDEFPISTSAQILSDPNRRNYSHFTLDMLPRLRFFEDTPMDHVIVSQDMIEKFWQRDLLGRVLRGRKVVPLSGPLRITDPLLAHTWTSLDGIQWLKKRSGLSVPVGNKLYYSQRKAAGTTRSGRIGGISESAEFLAFLEKYGFLTIDFADGYETMQQEIDLIHGARIILSPGGSNFTNTVYLDGPAHYIEVGGPEIFGGTNSWTARMLGINYHVYRSEQYDDNGNLIVNVDKLENMVKRILG